MVTVINHETDVKHTVSKEMASILLKRKEFEQVEEPIKKGARNVRKAEK